MGTFPCDMEICGVDDVSARCRTGIQYINSESRNRLGRKGKNVEKIVSDEN